MSTDTPTTTPVIIDHGSSLCRAGLAGTNAPSVSFPSLFARRQTVGCMTGTELPEWLVGEAAKTPPTSHYTPNAPVQSRVVTSWDDVESMWQYVFRDAVGVDPKTHPVLLTAQPLLSLADREKSVQVMFETLEVPAMSIQSQAALSLYAANRTEGVVLDVGQDVTHAVPVVDGREILHAVSEVKLGGRDLTDRLVKMVAERGHAFATEQEGRDVARRLKEELCYVSLGVEAEGKTEEAEEEEEEEKTYDLPDGTKLSIGTDRFQCPEALFNPALVGKADVPGLDKAVFDAVEGCDVDKRASLYKSVVLAGGLTLLGGLGNRLQNELQARAGPDRTVSVIAPEGRQHSSWTGGSLLASVTGVDDRWVTKEMYDERGPHPLAKAMARESRSV